MTLNYPAYNPSAVVRSWLFSKMPGMIEAESPGVCIARAHRMSGLGADMAEEVFAKTLRGLGFKTVCVRNAGATWPALYRLNLPSDQAVGFAGVK